jgi:hypothetical protein
MMLDFKLPDTTFTTFPVSADPDAPSSLYRWSPVPDGNMDELPDRLCPTDNCPKCGAAWVDYVAVGWVPEIRPWGISGYFSRSLWSVSMRGADIRDVSAVRLTCHADHRVDYDGRRLWLCPQPSWTTAAGLGLGIMAICYAGALFASEPRR